MSTTTSPNSPLLHAPTFRSRVKAAFQTLGLLPAFWFLRRVFKAACEGFWLLPLRTLGGLAMAYQKVVYRIFPEYRTAKNYFVDKMGSETKRIVHNGKVGRVEIDFYTPNANCEFRADSFASKEPETLEWLDEFGRGGVLYDIGANIGVYSLYYAKSQKATVYAFEPSVFNLAVLVKNININGLQSHIRCVFNPLTSTNQFADFRLNDITEGGALNAFGVDFGRDGKPLATSHSYQTLGLNLDYLLENKIITEPPALIKIDVDGIEHLILSGAAKTLAHPNCRSVLVEVDERFDEQGETVQRILKGAGFKFAYKKRNAEYEEQGPHVSSYNNIWVKG